MSDLTILTRRQLLASSAVTAIALTLGPRPGSAQGKLAGTELRIGAAFPLTGVWSEWGKKDKVALDMAVDEINAAGGVGGVPIKYVIYDTGSRPPESAALVRRLAKDDNVLALLGQRAVVRGVGTSVVVN